MGYRHGRLRAGEVPMSEEERRELHLLQDKCVAELGGWQRGRGMRSFGPVRDRILKDECWAALAQRNPRVFYPASLETYGRLCICLRDNRVVHSTRLAGSQREGEEG